MLSPFNTISRTRHKIAGPIQQHRQRFSTVCLGPFNNFGNVFWRHVWARPIPSAGPLRATVGPFNNIGDSFGGVFLAHLILLATFIWRHVWAHPVSSAGSFNKWGAYSLLLVTYFSGKPGPIQCRWQHLSATTLGPFNTICNIFHWHFWVHSITLAILFGCISGPTHCHRQYSLIIIAGPIHLS